jgi:carbamoyl-phosphate synthase/aspartate carbamoyltransferase/dihydroorotase
MKVTCEVTPHHLFLSEENLQRLGCCGSVKPNLVTVDDQLSLWENMDIIDCFATDHAPHLLSEKNGPNSPPGFPGLETALPLLLTAVSQGRLTIEQIIEKYHTNPIKIFHLEGLLDQKDTYIEVDIDHKWTIPESPKFSKAQWTPFAGMEVTGMVRRVVIRDKVVYVDGNILAKPGFGRNLGLIGGGPAGLIGGGPAGLIGGGPAGLIGGGPAGLVGGGPAGLIGGGPAGGSASRSSVVRSDSSENDLNLIGNNYYLNEKSRGINELRRSAYSELIDESVDSSNVESKMVRSSSLKMRSIYTVEDFSREDLRLIFNHTDQLRLMSSRELQQRLDGSVVGMIFYEPSTRTNCSFNAAIQRLGGKIVESDINNNSLKKGESFLDFVKCIQSYTDAIIIRCGDDLMELADNNSLKVPIINAGYGSIEHPTQALLDIYTIRQERGTVNGLKIAFMGDLKYGRTVHSLTKLLSLYKVEIFYISPEGLDMPEDIMNWIASKQIKQSIHRSLDEVIAEIDILYVTRIQKERMGLEEYQKLVEVGISKYHVTPKSLTNAKENLVIMHPLPRVDEISPEIDNDPRATYFRQMENGMWVRMGLLDLILRK